MSHGVFSLERTYEAPVERVWRALSDREAKAKWFGGTVGEWSRDRASHGLSRRRRRARQGPLEKRRRLRPSTPSITTSFPSERIVYSYTMRLNEAKISVSLATMELDAESSGRTRLKVTEQGAFLDGYDDDGSRERGTAFLLDKIGESLAIAP